LVFTVVNASGLSPALGGLVLLGVSLLAVFQYVLPMLRTWLRLDVPFSFASDDNW
jgi:hypothetical protein